MTTLESFVGNCFPYLIGNIGACSEYLKKVLLREYILNHKRSFPASLLDADFGGWVPDIGDELDIGSIFVRELRLRQILRRQKKFQEADLIKRVVCSGSVEGQDFPTGTLYFLDSVRLPA